MTLFYRLVSGFFGLFLRLFYRMEVRGLETLPKGPCLLAPNHTSFLDPPIMGGSFPDEIHFLAKGDLFKKPLIGWSIERLNSHPVDPSGDDTKSLRKVLELLKRGKRVLLFPEGGRSPDGKWLPFKRGIAMLSLHTGVPIVPVLIEGAHEIWEKGRRLPRLRGKLKVTYLPPLSPEPFSSLPKKEGQLALTEALFGEMEGALKRSRPRA